jgi:hypothetical protein
VSIGLEVKRKQKLRGLENKGTYVLDQRSLVFEGITLAEMVQFVVKVLVNLARGTVLDQQTTKDPQSAHPHDLTISKSSALESHSTQSHHYHIKNIPRHPSILGPLPLTKASMATIPPRSSQLPRASSRVHGDRFADDEAIRHQLADGLAGVGVGDFRRLVRIQPDLALAAADHAAGKTLLCAEIAPVWRGVEVSDGFLGLERLRDRGERV